MNFAFFFPGQGSQSLGMMAGFDGLPVVKNTFDEASDALNQNLWQLLNGSDADALNATVNTQPVMLAAGIAVWRAYRELGGSTPAVLAGHSLGEYTALTAAGSLKFADAVRLVRLRAQLMQNAVPQGEGAMAAVLGLDDDAVRAVCAQTEKETGGVAEAVNFNSPGQVVIAGSAAAVEHACTLAKAAGAKRALPLPVSVPSHCRLMKPAADELAQALRDVEVSAPSVRVLHNVDVASHERPDDIREALVKQLYSPVLWTQTVGKLVSEGITVSAECGPGKVLAGLAKRIDKTTACSALTDRAAVEQFIAATQAA